MKSPEGNIKIAVIGGDLRQIYTGISLADRGYEVAMFGFDKYDGDVGLCTRCSSISDALRNCDSVVLGNPVTNDGYNLFLPLHDKIVSLKEVLINVDKKCVILGGRTSNIIENYQCMIIDYFSREELIIANAYLTAEVAIGMAMSEINESLLDMSVLVMGYGRIGKSLCYLLKGMGANVYASARKESDFAWIKAYGYSPIDTSNVCEIVTSCKLVFNTIPQLVLGENVLNCLQKDTLIIDLASKPGGVDFEAAKKCGLKALWALALPGKKLPVSAGRAQASVILDMMEDKGVI